MSEALINSLNQRISELERSKGDLQRALKEARAERKTAVEKAESLASQVQQITQDRDGWKAKAEAAPTEKDTRITELETALRSTRFERAFEAEAVKAGVKPEAIADLFKLSGLAVPESDDGIKPEAFADVFTAAKEARPWAFGDAPQAGVNGHSQGIGVKATEPPPGSGRSVSGQPSGQVRYTREDLSRPDWMTARPDLRTALAEGRAVLVEG